MPVPPLPSTIFPVLRSRDDTYLALQSAPGTPVVTLPVPELNNSITHKVKMADNRNRWGQYMRYRDYDYPVHRLHIYNFRNIEQNVIDDVFDFYWDNLGQLIVYRTEENLRLNALLLEVRDCRTEVQERSTLTLVFGSHDNI